MKLTKAQIEYARRRIRTLLNDKFEKETSALVKPKTNKELTNEEKWDMVLAGKAKLSPAFGYKKRYDCIYLDNFDFPIDKKAAAAMEQYKTAESVLRSKYEALEVQAMDKLMLSGDADAALALIESLK